MEGDGRAVQSDADDDGHASATHHSAAQDDARPRDQEGDGGNAGQDERAERAGDVGDDHQPVRGRRPGPQEENRRGSFKYSETAAAVAARNHSSIVHFFPLIHRSRSDVLVVRSKIQMRRLSDVSSSRASFAAASASISNDVSIHGNYPAAFSCADS